MPKQTQNRLAVEQSPYLQQHADNPVDWYPWGDEAFRKAEKEDKPVFLSIGYATCHWCHVMAHESFEDDEVARLMNESFVNIKVDREERPDIDNTYMTVCQMLTGSGGWPLSIFLTPDKRPFYAATYIPKTGRHGRPGMRELIPWLDELWENEREKIYTSAESLTSSFRKFIREKSGASLTEQVLDDAYKYYKNSFNERHGGFGGAPKFPSPHNLLFLLRCWKRTGEDKALTMVAKTLTEMRLGGIFDQAGFGFHRYSTDDEWLVPHFEKMLYDQALLAMAYTGGWQTTGNPLFRQTTEEILQYVNRDLRDGQGGYYSAEDADSEGEEGKFYVWSTGEIRNLLSPSDADLAIKIFNMSDEGNYLDEATRRRTGRNILHLPRPIDELAPQFEMEPEALRDKIEGIRSTLFRAREKRIRPLLDDKILTDWNGLMIAALARAGGAFDDQTYIQQAREAAGFVLDTLTGENGRLLHRYRNGEAAIAAHADDYAFFIWGLLELYESSFETRYLEKAVELNGIFIEDFWDGQTGGFYFTAVGAEELLGRKKESYDGAVPSSNSVAMMNLLRIGRMTAQPELEENADKIGKLFSSQVTEMPGGFSQMLQAVDFAAASSCEIVLAGDRNHKNMQAFIRTLKESFIPNKVVLLNAPDDPAINELAPYTRQQTVINGKPTAYVCTNYRCEQPVNSVEEMMALIMQEQ